MITWIGRWHGLRDAFFVMILAIDDEPAVLRSLTRMLAGHEVICAANAAEALALLRDHSPDLILCDWHMPDVDGLAFIRLVKSIKPWIRCVLVTGDIGGDVVGQELGPDALLAKPWTAEGMREVLEGNSA